MGAKSLEYHSVEVEVTGVGRHAKSRQIHIVHPASPGSPTVLLHGRTSPTDDGCAIGQQTAPHQRTRLTWARAPYMYTRGCSEVSLCATSSRAGDFFGPSHHAHATISMDVYSRDPIDGIKSMNVFSHDFRRKFQVDILSLGSQHPSRI